MHPLDWLDRSWHGATMRQWLVAAATLGFQRERIEFGFATRTVHVQAADGDAIQPDAP